MKMTDQLRAEVKLHGDMHNPQKEKIQAFGFPLQIEF